MTLDARLASVVEAARSKKAFRIQLFDVSGIASFTDTFAFMSAAVIARTAPLRSP